MAKKGKKIGLTSDEQREQDTLEANVVAQEQAEAKAAAEMPEPPVVTPDDFAAVAGDIDELPPPTRYVPTYSPYGEHGQYAADKKADKELFAMINGVRYEHVSETPDGRWVYSKS